jgi:hypothetical protein
MDLTVLPVHMIYSRYNYSYRTRGGAEGRASGCNKAWIER